MRLKVSYVDHEAIRLAAFEGQGLEDAVEDAQTAPPDAPVIERLGWSVGVRRIAPTQAVSDHKDDPAEHATVIYAWDTVRKRERRLNPAKLALSVCPAGL